MRVASLAIVVIFFIGCSSNTNEEPAEIRQMRSKVYGIWKDDASSTISKLILKKDNTFGLEISGCFGQGQWSGKWSVLPGQVLLESDKVVENGHKSLDRETKRFVLKEGVLFENSVNNGAGYRKVK